MFAVVRSPQNYVTDDVVTFIKPTCCCTAFPSNGKHRSLTVYSLLNNIVNVVICTNLFYEKKYKSEFI